MSRSRRRQRFFNLASDNRKWYKRRINKAKRQKARAKIHTESYDSLEPTDEPWDWYEDPSDGKVYWDDAPEKEMSK